MTLPKRCWVSCWERSESGVRISVAAGEIRWAKSVREGVDLVRLWRTEAESAQSDCFRSVAESNDLNAVAKPTSRT
jgi:hypothetical protein